MTQMRRGCGSRAAADSRGGVRPPTRRSVTGAPEISHLRYLCQSAALDLIISGYSPRIALAAGTRASRRAAVLEERLRELVEVEPPHRPHMRPLGLAEVDANSLRLEIVRQLLVGRERAVVPPAADPEHLEAVDGRHIQRVDVDAPGA